MKFRWISKQLLLLISALLLGSTLCTAQNRPAFLLLTDNTDIAQETLFLQSQGFVVKQQFPPNILVADVPEKTNTSNFTRVKKFYYSTVPIALLKPMGVLAVAAGMDWNRRVVTQSKTQGTQAFNTIKSMAAQSGLGAPKNLTLEANTDSLSCSWNPVDSAAYYEVETALEASFKTTLIQTETNKKSVRIPLPEGTEPLSIFARVRPIDRISGASKNEDVIKGSWATASLNGVTPTSANTSLVPPQLTSPASQIKTTGFTVVLEWTNPQSPDSRIQISRDAKFTDIFMDEITNQNEFVCPSPLLFIGDQIFWRTKAWGEQKSDWSSSRSIRIGEPQNERTDMFVNPEMPK